MTKVRHKIERIEQKSALVRRRGVRSFLARALTYESVAVGIDLVKGGSDPGLPGILVPPLLLSDVQRSGDELHVVDLTVAIVVHGLDDLLDLLLADGVPLRAVLAQLFFVTSHIE